MRAFGKWPLLAAARRLGEPCVFVMVDTWSAARFTLDDNNANEVATVLAEFNKLALDYGTCIVFLEHITKNLETGKSAPRAGYLTRQFRGRQGAPC